MKTTLLVPLLLLAACASHPVENVSVPSPTVPSASRPQVNETTDKASQKFLESELQKKEEQARLTPPPRPPVSTTDDMASDRFLREEMLRQEEQARWAERQRAEAAQRAQPQVVERTVYVDRYYPYYDGPYERRYDRRSYSTFPAATILGGTVGGIIGHQSHHTGRGIAIGSGVGLLVDVLGSRW